MKAILGGEGKISQSERQRGGKAAVVGGSWWGGLRETQGAKCSSPAAAPALRVPEGGAEWRQQGAAKF